MLMKNLLKNLSIMVFAAAFLCACNDDSDSENKYENNKPLDENIIQLNDYQYMYNDDGLVEKVFHVYIKTEFPTQVTPVYDLIASITYPQPNKAVMEYTGDGPTTKYVFTFGENHFASKVVETGNGRKNCTTKYSYDINGHITKIERPDDKLELEWTNGNMTRIKQNDYDALTEITYGTDTDFGTYEISPFLTRIKLGPLMHQIDWWFDRGLEYALHIGFFGKPCTNLPETMTSYDNQNPTPQQSRFVYFPAGTWTIMKGGE